MTLSDTVRTTPEAIAALTSLVKGQVITPGTEDYAAARRVYNAMIDRSPAVILRCASTGDVVAGLRFGREQGLDVSVRSGGHNVAGFGTNDNGIVLDLSGMNRVDIDPARRTARVEGGATWADVDRAAWAFELATPGGIISTTGVAGLGLGGGFGHLTRRFGLVIDNLRSAEVITADGTLVHASADQNADLFWAIRGGGGNFGIVSSLELALHHVPALYGGPIFFPVSENERVLRFYRDFMADAPRELSAFFGFHIAPPAPFVPEHLHGHTACAIVVAYTGESADAEAAIRPIRDAAKVALDLAGPIAYPSLNSMFDALLPKGLHHYWKADFANEIPDAAIAVHGEFGPQVPTVPSLMHIYPMDGAVHDVASSDTAFKHRDVRFTHIIAGVDPDPTRMPERQAWVRNYWTALRPHSASSAYVNFLMNEGQERIRATYGDNYQRLADLKAEWDPSNVFHMNQNILPASSGFAG